MDFEQTSSALAASKPPQDSSSEYDELPFTFTSKLDFVFGTVHQHRAHRVQVVIVAAPEGASSGLRHLQRRTALRVTVQEMLWF